MNSTTAKVTPRVAIYVRLSDEDKNKSDKLANSESIKNQIALATKFARDHKWIIHDIYIDDDWSGLDRDRPEFNRLLRDCEAQKVDIVLCKDMSRFSRDKIITEEYLETKFVEWGIRFIGLSDGVDTADKRNKKSREINALVNQWYAEDISNKVRAALKIKRETGNYIGSFPPYGYKKSEHNKNKLEIDLVAARVVKRIFKLYLEGHGSSAIANILNQEKIPNPCTYKELTLKNYKNPLKKHPNSLWSKTSVKRILRNKVYIGVLEQRKIEKIHFKSKKRLQIPKEHWVTVENNHPPIIDRLVFFTVQKQMDAKIRSSGHGKVHLFAGKVFCKDCKRPLIKSSSGKYNYLSCSSYHNSRIHCSRHSIRLDKLTAIVEEQLRLQLSQIYFKKDKIIKELICQTSLKKEKPDYQIYKTKLINQLNDVNNAIKQLYIDKSKGQLEDTLWQDIFNQFRLEKSRLTAELARIDKELKSTESINLNLEKLVESLLNFSKLNRSLLNSLIKRIEIGELKGSSQTIIIYYTFNNIRNSLPT